MRLERSFGSYFPETHSSETRESIMNTTELEPFVPSGEVVLFSRIGEEPRSEKNKAGGSLENHPEKVQDLKRQSDWESFLSKPAPQQRFINLYGGPFGQQMELNRKNAEKLLEMGGIEGKLILVDLPMDRSRSIAGVNSDGSVTGRRRLFWGEKIEDEESPRSLVKSVPEGWRIEIPGQDIMEELSRQESEKPLGKRFVARFNQQLRQALGEVILREKLTTVKDPLLRRRIIMSLGPYAFMFSGEAAFGAINEVTIPLTLVWQSLVFAIINSGKMISPEGNSIGRKFGHRVQLYEFFLPYVQFDRVLRGLA